MRQWVGMGETMRQWVGMGETMRQWVGMGETMRQWVGMLTEPQTVLAKPTVPSRCNM